MINPEFKERYLRAARNTYQAIGPDLEEAFEHSKSCGYVEEDRLSDEEIVESIIDLIDIHGGDIPQGQSLLRQYLNLSSEDRDALRLEVFKVL